MTTFAAAVWALGGAAALLGALMRLMNRAPIHDDWD